MEQPQKQSVAGHGVWKNFSCFFINVILFATLTFVFVVKHERTFLVRELMLLPEM